MTTFPGQLSKQLLAVAVSLLVIGGMTVTEVQAKTLVFCSEGNPDSLSPPLARTNTSFDAINPVFDTLVRYDIATQSLVPSLAESWTISEDGLVYTFTLREGVQFQSTRNFTPTRPLTAEDVVFSFNRQWQPDHPYYPVSGGVYNYFNDLSMGSLLHAIEAVDARTVRFTLNQPKAPFLADLSMVFATITSAEYAAFMMQKGTPEAFDTEPLGTGPYQLVSYRKDALLRFKPFAAHWGGPPPLEHLIVSITPNAAVRLNKLQPGECHVMPFPNLADLDKIKADPALEIMEKEGYNVSFLTFNVQKKPFDDVRVRRAVSMAIDKATLVDALYGETGRIAKNPLPPTSWGYNDSVVDLPFDPAEATRLLAEAGYPDGFEIELWHMPVARPYMANAKRGAEMMRNDLSPMTGRFT